MNKKILVPLLAVVILVFFKLADAAQTTKIFQIGYLATQSPSSLLRRVDAFRQGLRDHGYIESQPQRRPPDLD
jgi:hypothetical protein